MDRLIDRLAPLAVLVGAAALLISLFLRYYEVPHGGATFTGWESFSKADILLAIAAAAGALAVVIGFATRARWPHVGAALAGTLAASVLIYVSDRPPAASLVKKAAAGTGAHGSSLILAYGAFVGIAGALVLPAAPPPPPGP
jgi:hypothetical protein